MIRGPVLPQAREALWALLAERLDVLERGLVLVAENVDCTDGRFGLADGLARDAMGAPVLLLVATESDAQLPLRVLAAAEFFARTGDALAAAVPEGCFCADRTGRVVVVGGVGGRASLDLVQRLAVDGLQVCRLEAFRIGGAERFAVRWLPTAGGASTERGDLDVPATQVASWDAVRQLCQRLDGAIRIDGDRFVRRISLHGRVLGEVAVADGELRATVSGGIERPLAGPADVRAFGDGLLRRYAQVLGLGVATGDTAIAAPTRMPAAPVETLRDTLSAARLSAEEYSALGAPGAANAPGSDNENPADYIARIVTEDRSWEDTRSGT